MYNLSLRTKVLQPVGINDEKMDDNKLIDINCTDRFSVPNLFYFGLEKDHIKFMHKPHTHTILHDGLINSSSSIPILDCSDKTIGGINKKTSLSSFSQCFVMDTRRNMLTFNPYYSYYYYPQTQLSKQILIENNNFVCKSSSAVQPRVHHVSEISLSRLENVSKVCNISYLRYKKINKRKPSALYVLFEYMFHFVIINFGIFYL